MTEPVRTSPLAIHQTDEQRRKPARKNQPAQFTHRITFSVAPDQVDSLAQAKKIFRASEAFMLRMAWDHFARANHLGPQVANGGQPNGR